MPLQDINALLSALKAKEGGGGMPASAAATPDVSSDPPAEPSADPSEESSEGSAEDNAKIVDILQQQYPKIYATISAQVESDDGSSDDSGAPPDMSSMMGGMPS